MPTLANGGGKENQNFVDCEYLGLCGDHPVLGLLQDPGSVPGAGANCQECRPTPEEQERQGGHRPGQRVYPAAAGPSGGGCV